MAVTSKNELRFLELKREIERYATIGDYEYTMKLIEQAMPLCGEISGETHDPEKKKVMQENAVKFKKMYAVCKAKASGEEVTYTFPGEERTPDKGKRPGAPSSFKEAEPKKDGKEDGVEYVMHGVDVRPFLNEQANDIVTFADVVGMEEEKQLIVREFFLTDEQRAFNEYLGKKSKTFILLYGVPGTGKTFFAKAISQELKNRLGGSVPFFSVIGSSLSDSKVGATEHNIQALFSFCKQFEHCVLFIDEFDTLAPDRKQANGDPTAASRVTVLLQMMDGFSSAKGTLLIAATNCPYNLDGAVLSRANARIEIPLPVPEVICGILRSKIGSRLSPDVDLEQLSLRLDGYSSRDVSNFVVALQDNLREEFDEQRARGDDRTFEEFRYTQEMVEYALERVRPTTKKSDLDRIAKFKENND